MTSKTLINTDGFSFSRKLKTSVNRENESVSVKFSCGDIVDNRYRIIKKISQSTGEADIYKVQDLQNSNAIMVLKIFRRRDAIKDEVISRLLSLRSP